MNFIVWIIFGAIAGWIASKIMNTDKQQGAIANIIVGIVGAFIGGLVVQLFGSSGVTGFNVHSFIVAVLGSVIFLAIFKMVRKHA